MVISLHRLVGALLTAAFFVVSVGCVAAPRVASPQASELTSSAVGSPRSPFLIPVEEGMILSPAFDPTGRRLALYVQETTSWRIMPLLVDLDEGTVARIRPEYDAFDASVPIGWSSDGGSLALVGGVFGEDLRAIVARAADGAVLLETPHAGGDSVLGVRLAPDGRSALYHVRRVTEEGASLELWMLHIPSGAAELVSFAGHVHRGAYAWSADGSSFYAAVVQPSREGRTVGEDQVGIWRVWASDQARRERISGLEALAIAVSPDERWIAAEAERSEGGVVVGHELLLIDAKEGVVTRLGGGSWPTPRWRRDGRRLAYVTAEGAMVVEVPSLTVTERSAGCGTITALFWSPDGELCAVIDRIRIVRFTPGGERVLCELSAPR